LGAGEMLWVRKEEMGKGKGGERVATVRVAEFGGDLWSWGEDFCLQKKRRKKEVKVKKKKAS